MLGWTSAGNPNMSTQDVRSAILSGLDPLRSMGSLTKRDSQDPQDELEIEMRIHLTPESFHSVLYKLRETETASYTVNKDVVWYLNDDIRIIQTMGTFTQPTRRERKQTLAVKRIQTDELTAALQNMSLSISFERFIDNQTLSDIVRKNGAFTSTLQPHEIRYVHPLFKEKKIDPITFLKEHGNRLEWHAVPCALDGYTAYTNKALSIPDSSFYIPSSAFLVYKRTQDNEERAEIFMKRIRDRYSFVLDSCPSVRLDLTSYVEVNKESAKQMYSLEIEYTGQAYKLDVMHVAEALSQALGTLHTMLS